MAHPDQAVGATSASALAVGEAPTASRRQRIVSVVKAACTACGHAISLAELRDAMTRANVSIPRTLAAEVSSLKRHHVLAGVWRGGAWRYMPPNFVEVVRAAPTEGERVLDTLRELCTAQRRMMSTREVHAELDRLGVAFDTHDRTTRSQESLLRHRLATMARARTTGRAAVMNQPLVRCTQVIGTDGRSHTYWAPADMSDVQAPATAGSASLAEAARTLVSEAERALGRPASRTELSLLVQQRPRNDPVRSLLVTDGPRPSVAVAVASAMTPAGGTAVSPITTPWTVYGGAPVRYTLQTGAGGDTVSALARDMIELDDTAYALRLHMEYAGASHLARRLARQDLQVLSPWLDQRRAALAWSLTQLRGRLTTALDLVCDAADAADQTVACWARRTVGTVEAPWAVLRDADARRAARGRIGELARAMPSVRGVAPTDLVGDCRTVMLGELAPWAGGVVDMDARDGAVAKALSVCRHFPPAKTSGRRSTSTRAFPGAEGTAARYDRAEALARLASLVPDPWTQVMSVRAYALLGEIARDAAPFARLLVEGEAAPALTSSSYRIALVAAGMLGADTSAQAAERLLMVASRDARREEDVRAAVLAMALCNPAALQDCLAAATRGPTQHLHILRRALTRVRGGAVLRVAAGW